MAQQLTQRDSSFRYWLGGVAIVAVTVLATTIADGGTMVAATIGGLVALAVIGGGLWLTGPVNTEAKKNLGAGLLVGVVAATAVAGAQLAIDDRRSHIENEREQRVKRRDDARAEKARQDSQRQSLLLSLGLRDTLVAVDLHKQDLLEARFAGRDLTKAQFDLATLTRANLAGAKLRYANLSRANLQGAVLRDVDFSSADLTFANLTGADLIEADLRTADLTGAILARAKLGSDLRGADLRDRDLRTVDFRGAQLRDADLSDARLEDSQFGGVDLRGQNLRRADLRRADLRGADLRGADLAGADLRGARGDARTRWPGCTPPPGVIVVLDGAPRACT